MDIDMQIEDYKELKDKYQLMFFALIREAEYILCRTYTTKEIKALWSYWLGNEFITIDDQLNGIIEYTKREL